LVGFEKPSAKTFQYLVLAAQCDREQILHLGDRLEDDFKGAKARIESGPLCNQSPRGTKVSVVIA
jgi:hypothetical protein